MDIRKTILAAAGVLLAGANANAAEPKTLYVDDNPNVVEGAERGSVGNPYTIIQDAVDAAAAGDTIIVAEGVYEQGETNLCEKSYSRVHIAKKPGLRLIGAGRGKSVIVGSRNSASDGFDTKDKYVRCVYVDNKSGGTVFEGFTLRDGEADNDKYAVSASTYGGGFYVGTNTVYFVDCDIVHCCARLGGGSQSGTAVRCLYDMNHGLSANACRVTRLVNCVVTRSSGSTSNYAAIHKAEAYNCTIIDNYSSYYALQESFAYNCLIFDECKRADAMDSTTAVDSCVLVSTASKGRHQVAGPAVGDWRPLEDSDAVGAGSHSHLETLSAQLQSLSAPAGIDVFKDFGGNPIVADANRKINAGALQNTVDPKGGALFFNYSEDASYEIDGYKPICAENRATWVYPETYPTQYCVKVNMAEGKHLYRVSRKNPLDGKDSIDYPASVPHRNGIMWMMPPVDPAMAVTNTVETAAKVLYVDDDPETASDEEGYGSADKPFLSIQKAVDTAANNQNTVVYLNPGVYTNGVFENSIRGKFRVYISDASKKIRIVSTSDASDTVICGAADLEAENGLGTGAIKGIYLDKNTIVQNVTIADCFTDKDKTTWSAGHIGAAVYSTSSPGEYPPQLVDVVITNCHARENVAVNYVVYKRCRFVDCSSQVGYGITDSNGTKRQYPMFACYVRNMTLYDDSKSSYGVVGGDARIYQSTFAGTLGSGRLTGGGNVSFNSIWYGGKNIYSDSNYTNCIVYNPSGDANGIYGRVDPLFADHTLDGTLCLNSPAFAGGDVPSVDNFGSDYWRYACGDINGGSIAFSPDGRPTLGAFQEIANMVGVSVAKPVGGGWRLADGLDYGSFRLSEGQSISAVKTEGVRNCLGIKAGDREFEFGEDGSIVLGFDDVASLPVKNFEGWYSTNWYVNANADESKGPVGSDDNDGFTPETPKRTLAAAAALLYPGDTLHAAPGTYDDGDGCSQKDPDTPNRVVVKSNTSVVADDGPLSTFIIGGAAEGRSMRCAYVESNARLSGFTLTGGTNGNESAYNGDLKAMGSAILGVGRDDSSVAENCIISNNYGNVGTVAYCDLVGCRVVGNTTMAEGCGVRQGNAYGCFFDGNVGNSVLNYCRDVWNCTITTNNVGANGVKCTSISSMHNGGSAINTFIGYKLTPDSKASVTIDHCVIGAGGYTKPETAVVEVRDLFDVGNAPQMFDENGVPVAGANAAVDNGDASKGFKYPGNTDLRGFQRVMNGAMDIGCYEADWRSVYGDILSGSRKFTVTAADAQVKAVKNSVEIASGSLACEWANPVGRTVTYSFVAQVVGSGVLSVVLNGEEIAAIKATGAAQTFICTSKEAKGSFVFTYVPAEGEDAGKAVLGSFARTAGSFAISVR